MRFPFDTSTPVVILQSGHHGGLAITRSLGRLGIYVSVVDASRRTPAHASAYCKGSHQWDMDAESPESSLAYLQQIGADVGGRPVLIPTSDSTALFVATHSESLSERFRFPILPPGLCQSLADKQHMRTLALCCGIATPEIVTPASEDDLLQFADRTGYPVMLKVIQSHRAAANMRNLIVHTRKELLASFAAMNDSNSPNVMLQEYIPGNDAASWMFNGYFDERSQCLFGATGRKLRQNRPYSGVTSLGVCERNDTVFETAVRFMKAVGYRGILDVGFRYDRRDGKYKVYDVNPRIGCTFRLFATEEGFDVARAMYLHLTGQAVLAGSVCDGRKWMVEDLDFTASVRYWRDGNLTIADWLKSFRGIDELAFLCRDDLRPVWTMLYKDLEYKLTPRTTRARRAQLNSAPANG